MAYYEARAKVARVINPEATLSIVDNIVLTPGFIVSFFDPKFMKPTNIRSHWGGNQYNDFIQNMHGDLDQIVATAIMSGDGNLALIKGIWGGDVLHQFPSQIGTGFEANITPLIEISTLLIAAWAIDGKMLEKYLTPGYLNDRRYSLLEGYTSATN